VERHLWQVGPVRRVPVPGWPDLAVEAREGGADGRSNWYDFDDQDEAMETVDGLIESPYWRQLNM
jgi:hypothetical protein